MKTESNYKFLFLDSVFKSKLNHSIYNHLCYYKCQLRFFVYLNP